MNQKPLLLIALAGFSVLAAFCAPWIPYLWIFPLSGGRIALWILWVFLDLMSSICINSSSRFRFLRYFLALGFGVALLKDAPPLVVLGMLAPLLSIFAIHLGVVKLLRWGIPAFLLGLFLFGRSQQALSPDVILSESNAMNLICLFYFFRWISLWIAICLREEVFSFESLWDFFYSPCFFLFPALGNNLLMEKFKVRKTELVEWKAIGWLFQGLARSLFMVILIQHLLPKINSVYGAGFSKISFFSLLVLGPALFFISYVEKSRVSYWVAGILRLRGYEIEPDFRSPWMATDLLDYWRRFHYWIWEFYSDSFFGPLSVLFSRWWGAYMALSLSIFLTFVIGTTISHLIYYPGGVGLTIVLSFLFGLATLFHLLIVVKWQNIYLKRTFTWITVWCLYICAYPIFGLGWDLNQLMEFWNK